MKKLRRRKLAKAYGCKYSTQGGQSILFTKGIGAHYWSILSEEEFLKQIKHNGKTE